MKKLIKFFCLLLIVIGLQANSFGQTTLYTETFDGNGGAWPAGWSVVGGSTTYAINATSASSTYTSPNASGSYNAANGSSGTATLLYNNILSTVGYTNI